MPRKNDVNSIGLTIDGVFANKNLIKIKWSSTIGFGEYDIEINEDGKIIGHSESMDSGYDKEFVQKLFSLLTEKLEVKS